MKQQKLPPRIRGIVQETCDRYGFASEIVLGSTRMRLLVDCRAAIAQRLRKDGYSTSLIGRWLGRDHSTIISLLKSRKPVPVGPASFPDESGIWAI